MKEYNQNHAFTPGYANSILPEQAIPSSKKTKKWLEATAYALMTEARKQIRDNRKFVDYYRSVDGEITEVELKDIMPELREVVDIRDKLRLPSFLKHYDIIGIIINTFVGWLTGFEDKYAVVGLDEYEMNDYLFAKTELLHNYLKQSWDLKLNQALIEKGIDPTLRDFVSEEERQAYEQQIMEAKVSITPPEIQRWMQTSWKSAAVQWGSKTLEADMNRFHMKELDVKNFRDLMISGRCFRHHFVGFDYYRPEVWSPVEVFYSRNIDNEYPQYGDFIGRLTAMSATQIITRYGQYIDAKTKQKLVGGQQFTGTGYYPYGYNEPEKRKPSLLNWYKNEVIPFEGYYDYMNVLAYQNYTGLPMGEEHYFDKDGTEHVRPRYMPDFAFSPAYMNIQRMLSDDPFIRRDLFEVMEAYFVSYKRVLYITYESESGLITQQMVTDDILPEFLKENGIEKRNLTLLKGTEEPEVNTYFEDYVPEVRRVIMVQGGNIIGQPLILDGEPIPYQIKGDSNVYDFQLPVTGYVGPSPMQRAMPWQAAYNNSLNKLFNAEQKEIGKIALFDITFLPSEFSNWGNMEESFGALTDIAKSVGLLGIDMSRNNTAQSGGNPFNQFAQIDLTNTQQMQQCIANATFYRSMALEAFGITPQVLGTPGNYITAEGVKQGYQSTMIQVQDYFNHFDWFKKRTLNTHLAVAQMCQKEGKDQTVFYTKSDLSIAFLHMSMDDLPLRHLGVMAVSDSAMRKQVEQLKQTLASMNFAGSDILAWAKLYTSSSVQEILQAGIEARMREDQLQQRQFEQNKALQDSQQQAMIEDREDKQAHEMELESVKGENRLNVERIKAAGIAAGKQSNAESLRFVDSQAKLAMSEARDKQNAEIQMKNLELKEAKDKMQDENEKRKLDLEEAKIKAQLDTNATQRYTSTINKN